MTRWSDASRGCGTASSPSSAPCPGWCRPSRRALRGWRGTAHLLIDDVDSEPLLFLLDDAGVAASAGSACASGAAAASHVLAAIGVDAVADGRRRGALRLTLGHDATDGQVDRAVEVIAATVERLRAPARRLTPDREG